MPKILQFLSKLFIAAFVIFFSTFQASAAEGDILFSDNFSDGNLEGWTIESGNWFINNGNLAGSKSGRAFAGRVNTGSSEWDNYSIELDVNNQQGINEGIGFRYTPGGDSYELNLRHGTGSFNTPEAILRKNQDGVVTVVGDTHSFPLINQKWYHLKIEVLNENIKIWIDNNLIFDIRDIGTKVKKGILTLSYWTGDVGVVYVRFDNIKVTALAPPPSSKTPLILIPGIGGSELKVEEETHWLNQDDGHGGKFNYIYPKDEKVWVNEGKAGELGDDDYFDVLRMKTDGITSEANIGIGGSLVMRAYGETINFFTSNGYELNEDFFVFPYDWRLDNAQHINELNNRIQEIKTQTGSAKVDIIAHSMGGLIARAYISDPARAQNVRKLFTLGTPHLGAPKFLQAIRYGICLVEIGPLCPILAISEVNDVLQNLISGYQLAPSQVYFNLYTDTDISHPYPYRTESGSLNYFQIKDLLGRLNHNTPLFTPAESFHLIDNSLESINGVDVINIVGSGQPTIGQIIELKTLSLSGVEDTEKNIRIR